MRCAALAVLTLISAAVSAASSPEAVEAAARAGDYQAQRNTAFGYFRGDSGFPLDEVKACMWTAVIVLSGNPRANVTDANNLDIRCGAMSPSARALAMRQAEELAPTIDWRKFEKKHAAEDKKALEKIDRDCLVVFDFNEQGEAVEPSKPAKCRRPAR